MRLIAEPAAPWTGTRKEAVAIADYPKHTSLGQAFSKKGLYAMKHSGFWALGCALLLTIGFIAAPAASTAQTSPAPTPVPIPKPDFASMNFLLGTWTCTQPLRGKTRTETDVYAVSNDGMWMVDTATSPPFDQYRTLPQNSTTSMTYDPTIKQWVQVYMDNFGGYATAASTGWQGNAANWSAKGLDGTVVGDVITKVSDTETSDANTTTDPQGKVTTVTITCKKSS